MLEPSLEMYTNKKTAKEPQSTEKTDGLTYYTATQGI